VKHRPPQWTHVHELNIGGSALAGRSEEDLIRRAVAALNAGDIDGYLDGFSPDSLRWASGRDTPLTVDDIQTNLTLLTAAFDQLHLNEDLLFGARGHVCARWTLRGTHLGDYLGIAATRREIAVETCEVYAFAGTIVAESWVYGDTMSLFNQISERP
jgi:predicted ester cyclase